MTLFKPFCLTCNDYVTCRGDSKNGTTFPCVDCATPTELREVIK